MKIAELFGILGVNTRCKISGVKLNERLNGIYTVKYIIDFDLIYNHIKNCEVVKLKPVCFDYVEIVVSDIGFVVVKDERKRK